MTSPTTIYDPLSGIDWGTALDTRIVTFHFYAEGEKVELHDVDADDDGEDDDSIEAITLGWTQYEKQQFLLAFQLFERYLDITFVEADSSEQATFHLGKVPGDTIFDALGLFMAPERAPFPGLGLFNPDGGGWEIDGEGTGLEQGGYGFITIIHELGHGLGLAHPHDDGGTSTIFPGVTADDEPGEFGLNDQVYTMMSYNDGWAASPFGTPDTADYGWVGTPMAFDLAVLQAKYGANPDHNGDDTVYWLADVNETGTFYQAIWDTGGIDTIRYEGERDVVINLNPATLAFEFEGGGAVSYADGIHGGYTIAHGVVIERAESGSGDDVLVGNAFDNVFRPGAGDDWVYGGDGLDTVVLSSDSASASLIQIADGIQVQSMDGLDSLLAIERVVFNDRTLAFDLDGTVGEVFLLYQATLGRAADEGGLGYWVGEQAQGTGFDSLDVAASFLASDEYALRDIAAPGTSDSEFLEQLYADLFQRVADHEGRTFWEGLMADGVSKAQVLVAFVESDESAALVAPLLDTGVWMV